MKKASVLVFILCTLCSQVAFAASWYWIGQDTSGDQWYIDNASVQKNYNDIIAPSIARLNLAYGNNKNIQNLQHYKQLGITPQIDKTSYYRVNRGDGTGYISDGEGNIYTYDEWKNMQSKPVSVYKDINNNTTIKNIIIMLVGILLIVFVGFIFIFIKYKKIKKGKVSNIKKNNIVDDYNGNYFTIKKFVMFVMLLIQSILFFAIVHNGKLNIVTIIFLIIIIVNSYIITTPETIFKNWLYYTSSIILFEILLDSVCVNEICLILLAINIFLRFINNIKILK